MALRKRSFMPRVAADPWASFRVPIRRLAKRVPACCVAAAVVAIQSVPSYAPPPIGGKGLPIIRDAEIEQLLRDYTTPILQAAGLAQQNVHVVILQDRAFNAFVMDGRR